MNNNTEVDELPELVDDDDIYDGNSEGDDIPNLVSDSDDDDDGGELPELQDDDDDDVVEDEEVGEDEGGEDALAEFVEDSENEVEEGEAEGHGAAAVSYSVLEGHRFTGFNSKNITAESVACGRDIQGIPWQNFNITREIWKKARKNDYHNNFDAQNFVETEEIRQQIEKERIPKKQCTKDNQFYDFHYHARAVRNSVTHFQLRNLLWAVTKNDLYYTYRDCVYHYCPISLESTLVMDLSGQLPTPIPKIPSRIPKDLFQYHHVNISTAFSTSKLLAVGGYHGEVTLLDLKRGEVIYFDKVTYDENAITNALEITKSGDSYMKLVCSNNDNTIRIFDISTMMLISQYQYPYCVNYTSLSPDEKIMCMVGDNTDVVLADSSTGTNIATLKGHYDYGFAANWHPSGNIVATGNQDKTVRLWDVRNTGKCYGLLEAEMTAMRSIRFTEDGKYMAVAESADYVHLYDTHSGYTQYQQIDFFGEIGGISFSPCGEFLYIAIVDENYGGIMDYVLKREDLLLY